MDSGGHWEETILARLEHGFSSLSSQFADVKSNIVNQQVESAGLRHEIRNLRCVLEDKIPGHFQRDGTSPKEYSNFTAVEEAEGGGKCNISLADSSQTVGMAPPSAGASAPSSAHSANTVLPESSPILPDTEVSLPLAKPDRTTLKKMQTMQVALDEDGQKTKYFKLRDIWDADDAALQRLSADASHKTNIPQTDHKRIGYRSASRLTPTEKTDSAHLLPRWMASALWGSGQPASAHPRRKEEKAPKASPWALHPHSIPRLIWDLGGVALLCYDFALIPLQTFDLPNLIILQIFHWTTRLYWTLDVFASFLTGYYQDGKLEMRLPRIVVHYATRWLVLDLIIVFPEWVVVFSDDASSGGKSLGAQGLLRGVRGVRFLRLLRLAKVQRMVYLVEARVNSSYMLLCLGILRLLAGLIMVIHFFACAWYWIGQMNEESGWVFVTGIYQKDFTERYVSCFQWSLHQFHPASRKEMIEGTLAERIFVVICALVGLAISSVFVSSITNTMLQLQSLQEERTKQLRAVREFVLEHSISLELALRAKKYVRARLEDALRRKYENELLELLPESLLTDLHEEARWPIVAHHHFFSELRADFPRTVRRLCHEAMAEFAAHSGDVVFHAGDVCKRFFFVERGDLRYYLNLDVQADSPGTDGNDGEFQDLRKKEKTTLFDDTEEEDADEDVRQSDDGVPISKSCSRMSNSKGGVPVHAVSYLSEATLWTYWEHRGALKAKANSGLLTVNAAKFAPIIKDTAFAFIDAAVYAKKFVQRLNEDPAFRSDLIVSWGLHQSNSIAGSTMAISSWRMQLRLLRTPMSTITAKAFATSSDEDEDEEAPRKVVRVQHEQRKENVGQEEDEEMERVAAQQELAETCEGCRADRGTGTTVRLAL